jgi:hypothetical protein
MGIVKQIFKLLEWLATHHGGLGLIPSQDMSVSGVRMELTLVESLHRDDPDVIFKHADLHVPDSQGASLASAIRVKAVESLLLAY